MVVLDHGMGWEVSRRVLGSFVVVGRRVVEGVAGDI